MQSLMGTVYLVVHSTVVIFTRWAQINFSTLNQRLASTFLSRPQRWYSVEYVTMINQNQLLNHNSTKNQPSLKLKYQHWKMGEIRLKFGLILGWFEVEKLIFSWSLLHFQLISQKVKRGVRSLLHDYKNAIAAATIYVNHVWRVSYLYL